MSFFSALFHLTSPRESNNFKARLLHSPVLIILILFFVVLQVTPRVIFRSDDKILGYASQISIDEVIRLTNQKRAEAGLPPVVANSTLSQAAQAKARDMLAKGYWAHVAPDGTQPWDFFKNVGYKYRYAGENLARDFSSAASAVDAWMASPSHKENMLSSRYHDIGIAVVEGNLNGSDATIVVQLFGTLASDAPAIPVAAAQAPAPQATPRPIALATATPAPTPAVVLPTPPQLSQLTTVLVQAANTEKGREDTSKAITIGFLGFVIVLFIIDAIVSARRNLVRLTGRPLAHLSFLAMIIIVVLIIRAGQII